MRTTLVISDPIYERASQAAKRGHRRLSELVTEALETSKAFRVCSACGITTRGC